MHSAVSLSQLKVRKIYNQTLLKKEETPLRSVLNEIMIKFYCSTEDTIIYEFAHAKPLFMSNTEKRRKKKCHTAIFQLDSALKRRI